MMRGLIKYANDVAGEHNHYLIGTEHILLALLNFSSATEALEDQGIRPEEVQAEVNKFIGPVSEMITISSIIRPLTSTSKKAIDLSRQYATKAVQYATDDPTSLNILYGLCKEGEDVAAQVLKQLGFSYIKEKTSPEHILRENDFKIRGNKAYVGDDTTNHVVNLNQEKPIIMYYQSPRLIGKALDARKLFEKNNIPYNEIPSLEKVIRLLNRSIQKRSSLIDKILDL